MIYTVLMANNPAPVDRWFIPLFTMFYTSQVVQGFFHQQHLVIEGKRSDVQRHCGQVLRASLKCKNHPSLTQPMAKL